MNITEVSDQLLVFAHEGEALSEVKVQDDNGLDRTIDSIELVTYQDGRKVAVIKTM